MLGDIQIFHFLHMNVFLKSVLFKEKKKQSHASILTHIFKKVYEVSENLTLSLNY